MPADLQSVIRRCLEKDPGCRYPDAETLDRALAACRKRTGPWTAERGPKSGGGDAGRGRGAAFAGHGQSRAASRRGRPLITEIVPQAEGQEGNLMTGRYRRPRRSV